MSSSEVTITLAAIDNASEVIYSAASNVEDADAEITDSTEQVAETTSTVNTSTTQTAMGFNNLATSGMALYMGINNVENAQVALDRAHLQVEKATNAVTAAQLAYNTACEKYGPNSKEAQDALAKLQTAQDALTVAQERAGEAQRNYNNTVIFSALSIIPSLITAFTSILTIAPTLVVGINSISAALDMMSDMTIIGIVITAIAALVLGLIYAYEHCAPFRDAINEIGAALGGAILTAANDLRDALNFLWNKILVPIADFLEKVFLKAIDDVVGAIKPFQTAVSDVSSVAGDLSKGVSDLGGALSHLCFIHAAPAAEVFNKTLKESIDLTDALTGKTNSLASSLFSVSGSVAGPGGVGGGGTIGAAAALAGGRGPTINITAPLVQIQGSADKTTAQMAAKLVQQSLKNVTVESTSHATFSSHKRILLGYNK